MAPTLLAVLENDSATKPPILRPGDITPDVMRNFEIACLGYFENKDIPVDKHVRKILSCLKDSRIIDWISFNRECLLELSFTEFMTELCAGYLEKDWEAKTRHQLLGMFQHSDSFWNYSIRVQAKNSLLINTDFHLDKNKLRNQLEAGMNEQLSKKCAAEKVNKVINFLD
jgi:hypothetical protein